MQPNCSATFFSLVSTTARSSSIRLVLLQTPRKRKRFPELPYLTLRLVYLACEYFNADMRARARSCRSIRRFIAGSFCTRPSAEPRSFPEWLLKKVVLMASDFRACREEVLARFPIMRSSAFERRMLFRARRAAASIRCLDQAVTTDRNDARCVAPTPELRPRGSRWLRPETRRQDFGPIVPCLHHRATFTTH